MKKLKKKKNLKKPHISYKYIVIFCLVFTFSNFFIEKIANKLLISKPTISSIGPIGNLETIDQIKNRLN